SVRARLWRRVRFDAARIYWDVLSRRGIRLPRIPMLVSTDRPWSTAQMEAQDLCSDNDRFLDLSGCCFAARGERKTVVSRLAARLGVRHYCDCRTHLLFLRLQAGVPAQGGDSLRKEAATNRPRPGVGRKRGEFNNVSSVRQHYCPDNRKREQDNSKSGCEVWVACNSDLPLKK